jgi:hypothetical protein
METSARPPAALERNGRWLTDIEGASDLTKLSALDVVDSAALTTAASWATEFLTNPHADLGRDGEVCPFTGPSMRLHAFYMTVSADRQLDDVMTTMRFYREWFPELEPTAGPSAQLRTILVVFPNLAGGAGAVLDAAQEELKFEFVGQGLMIGQFHSDCSVPGVHNPNWRPLRSPVPILAIRYMVAGDGRFLVGDAYHLGSYLAYFGTKVPPELEELMHEALGRYNTRILFGHLLSTASRASSSQTASARAAA